MKNTKYTEIFKLKRMLDKIDLNYEFVDRSTYYFEQYQIMIHDNGKRIISVIEGDYSYGGDLNKLEIMGLLTDEEKELDSVVGWLSADDVYERIMKYYGSRKEL